MLLAAVLALAALVGLLPLARRHRALQRRHAVLAAVLEAADVALVAVDAQGRTLVENAVARAAADPDRSALGRALAGQHVRDLARDAGDRSLVDSARPVRLPGGGPAGAVGVTHDVTAARGRERALAAHAADLEALADARTAVLAGDRPRDAVCAAAAGLADASGAWLFEPDGAGGLRSTAASGPDLSEVRMRVDGLSCTALAHRSGEVQVVADVRRDPRTDHVALHALGAPAARASLHVPVLDGGRVRAVLVLALPAPLPDGEVRLPRLLGLLAADAALALARDDLTRELAAQASTDPLTGLLNRRAWDAAVRRATAVAERRGAPLTLVALDVDRFKAYNDAHGHAAGDALLQAAAQSWLGHLRSGDVLARTGGEEFVVLVHDADAEAGRRLAERLLTALPDGQTCSAGVAEWGGDTADALLARADEALYAAKQSGRARAVVARPASPALRPTPYGRVRL